MQTVNDNPIILYATGIIGVLALILSFSQKLGGALEKWASARRRAAQEANEEYTTDLKTQIAELRQELKDARDEIGKLRDKLQATTVASDDAVRVLRDEYRAERVKWEQREVSMVAENWKLKRALAGANIDPADVVADEGKA